MTVIKLCKITNRLYGLTPGELIDRMKSTPQQN
jgi:hypothetical protein